MKPVLLGPCKGTRFSAPQGRLAVPRGWRFCAGAGLGGTHAWGSGPEGRGPCGGRRPRRCVRGPEGGSSWPRTRSSVVHAGAGGEGASGRVLFGAPDPPSRRPRLGRLCVVPDVAGRGRWGHTQTRTRAVDTAFTDTCASAHGAHTRTQNSTWSWPEPARAQREGGPSPGR